MRRIGGFGNVGIWKCENVHGSQFTVHRGNIEVHGSQFTEDMEI